MGDTSHTHLSQPKECISPRMIPKWWTQGNNDVVIMNNFVYLWCWQWGSMHVYVGNLCTSSSILLKSSNCSKNESSKNHSPKCEFYSILLHKIAFKKQLDVFHLTMANRLQWLIMNQLFSTKVTKRQAGANPLSGI